ncbi:MAG: ABC transporter ATP-binding protein [Alphaproteobacteria bacterium]|nr:ABC transporter ATP-binding protein [Alphaproteobacteria bacterium]
MIDIENLHVHYESSEGRVHAVKGININVERGQFYTMLGPSGCGKTTTLRSVAGLERPSGGTIRINDEPVFSAAEHIMVPPYRREIGMVFQSYAIWPHMDVFNNVAFPLQEMKGRFSKAEIREKVMKALDLVQLDGYEDRPAPFLSGGQQQRLALARALVREPAVLLLDEPLSNLDAKLREETRTEIRDLVKRLGITTIYVTHDQLEALTMSDVIAVMDQGLIVQEGSPVEIYRTPAVRFVADFIGLTNFIEGRITSVTANGSNMGDVETASGMIKCELPTGSTTGDKVVIVIRPEDVNLMPASTAAGGENMLQGEVAAAMFMGDAKEYKIALKDSAIRLRLHPTTEIDEGQSVLVEIPAERCRALAG